MGDIKPNSNKWKITKATDKKKPPAKVFSKEDLADIRSNVLNNLIKPILKRALSEIAGGGLDMVKDRVNEQLYGPTWKSKASNRSTPYVSYRNYSKSSTYTPAARPITTAYNFDNITVDTVEEAKDVLTRMDELIDRYGAAKVTDFCEVTHQAPPPYTMNKYGWTSLRTAEIVETPTGYGFRLPRPYPIER